MSSAVDALALDEWWVMDAGLRLGEVGIAERQRTKVVLGECLGERL